MYKLKTIALVGCFAIYQIMFGWKTYEYYHETDELPNPTLTQPKKKKLKSGIWAIFFFPQQIIFVGRDWFYIGNKLQET